MTWKCICLDPSLYFGEYCQLQTTALTVKKAMSKSFASVAIAAITCTCSFVVLMDVLKYAFHVDPVKTERMKKQQQKEQEKQAKRAAKAAPKVVVRFHYVA
jgi:hypothetical protein